MLIPSRAWGFIRSGLNGRFGVTVPNFGTGGTEDSPLLNDVDAGDEAAGVEFCPVFAAQEASGTLTVRADGSLSFVGAADGTYVIPYSLYTFTPGDSAAVDEGDTDVTVVVGAASTITSASCAATTSTIAAASTATAAITSAEGTSAAGTLIGGVGSGSTVGAAAGASAASALAGSSIAESAITATAGAATASTLTGSDGASASAITPAAGSAAAQIVVGASFAQSAITAAAGAATAATMVGDDGAAAPPLAAPVFDRAVRATGIGIADRTVIGARARRIGQTAH